MSDNNEEVLRRSLDAVDRHRNRLLMGVVLTAVLLVAAFMHLTSAAHSGSTPLILHAIMVILGVWTTMMTLVVVIQITVMQSESFAPSSSRR